MRCIAVSYAGGGRAAGGFGPCYDGEHAVLPGGMEETAVVSQRTCVPSSFGSNLVISVLNGRTFRKECPPVPFENRYDPLAEQIVDIKRNHKMAKIGIDKRKM